MLPQAENKASDTFDTTGLMEFPLSGGKEMTAQEITSHLASVYCEGIGYEAGQNLA